MNKTTEVMEHFKAQYPNYIFFFSVDKYYESYDVDKFPVLKNLGASVSDSVARFPAENILDVVGRLSSMGCQCKLIVSRDDEGKRNLPDVIRINQEMLDDY